MILPRSASRRCCLAVLLLIVSGTIAAVPAAAQTELIASDTLLIDRPNDNGTALLLTFAAITENPEGTFVAPEVLVEGEWLPGSYRARKLVTVPTQADFPEYFGWYPATPDHYVLTVDR